MTKKQQSDRGEMESPKGRVAVPLDAQLRLAKTRKQLAVARYKIGVRQGSAWLNPGRRDTLNK